MELTYNDTMVTTPEVHLTFLDRLVSPLVMWSLVMAGAVVCWFTLSHDALWRDAWWMTILFIVGIVYWITMMRGALAVNRQAAQPTVKNTAIVDRGVYGIVRHPIYSGDVYLMTVLALAFPNVWTVATCGWAIVVFIAWMFLEETELKRKFGSRYDEYRKRVPMIMPNITRPR